MNDDDVGPTTLRDYFASMALMGGIAGPIDDSTHKQAAEEAYKYADAMLAARSASQQEER